MRLTTWFLKKFCCVCVCYMHECVHARMCACVVRAFVGDETQDFKLQTEPHPQPSLIPFLNSCSSHSLLGSAHWTLRSPRPLMIKYLVQCRLHPVASSSEGFGSQDAGRQMGAQALSPEAPPLRRWLSTRPVPAVIAAPLWFCPGDFWCKSPTQSQGGSRTHSPSGHLSTQQENSSKSLPKGQAPMWQPTQKQKVGTVQVMPCAPHRHTACHMRARIYFCVGNPKILLFLEGAQTGLKSDVPCFQGAVQAKQWNCISVKLPFQPYYRRLSLLECQSCLKKGQHHASWQVSEGAHCLFFPERRTQSPFCTGWN